MRFFFLLLLPLCLCTADFDCILIGSSPFSLFEALYQFYNGKKVLILEEDARCGGAWKGIDVCGIMNVDLGCHQIGSDLQLKSFLEEFGGCKIVSLDHPRLSFEDAKGQNGWYFSKGCHELIDNLLKRIQTTDILLLNGHKAEKAEIDIRQNIASIYTKEKIFTTHKLILTPTSCLTLYPSTQPQQNGKSKYFHLYLLIQDPTEPRFTYRPGAIPGVSRVMNLTQFADLDGTGRQLIIFQTYNEPSLANGQTFLDALKKTNLIDASAYILNAESCIYETGTLNQNWISQMGVKEIVEVLQTGHFRNLCSYIPRWKEKLKPYHQVVPPS